MMDTPELRILDANANRAREGLRVAEEHARFVLDRADLCERFKRLRHELAAALALVEAASGGDLCRARDTAGDVGTVIATASERARSGTADVARAAVKRTSEALRALEEYGKIISAEAAARFERIRYGLYEAESLLFAAPDRKARLRDAALYVLVTESLSSTDARTATREAVAGGADIIQMREKQLEDKAFLELATELRDICRAGGALFLINDRPHIAALADADGIHTGQGDLPVHLARRIVGFDRIIGRSTGAPEFAEAAFADGADYIGVGPVHETKTKEHRAPVGLEYVRYAATEAKLPYFCIGSINRTTLGAVLDAGARAVAVCTAIIGAADIAAETAWFKQQILARRAGGQ